MFVALSREQEVAAFQSCAANPDSCATTSSMVANAQARAEQLKDLAATAVAPNAQHVFALLLAENNEVQNALAQVTAGAKVDSVVQELQKPARVQRRPEGDDSRRYGGGCVDGGWGEGG
ncbi:hypothetical protein, partial [Pseudomonas rhizosphaerae]|jgi:hypothetical protein|uniref:hypothetical protein n=1 Tax=Pseudomonas rhizosphaerae TaxID=216142 RepID=UPI002B486A5D